MRRALEVLTTFEVAMALGAQFPGPAPAHRRMKHSGEHILLRIKENGLALFWRIEPELLAKSS